MLKKIISISLTMAVIGWPMGGQIGWAKGKAEDPVAAAEVIKANVAKLGLGMKSEVTVKLRNKAQIKGHVAEAGDNSVSIVDSKSGELKTVAYREVKELRGKGLSRGAKIAIWSGVGVGVLLGVSAILWSLYGD
jgi:hypothetical protein